MDIYGIIFAVGGITVLYYFLFAMIMIDVPDSYKRKKDELLGSFVFIFYMPFGAVLYAVFLLPLLSFLNTRKQDKCRADYIAKELVNDDEVVIYSIAPITKKYLSYIDYETKDIDVVEFRFRYTNPKLYAHFDEETCKVTGLFAKTLLKHKDSRLYMSHTELRVAILNNRIQLLTEG